MSSEPASPSVWRFVRASRAHVVVDAASYFANIQAAMLRARQQILLVGWDFDTRIRLGGGRRWFSKPNRRLHPARLGWFVIWLVQRTRGLQVRVLKWRFSSIRFLLRGSMIVDLIRWIRHPAIRFKFDAAHPIGCSHHQKIVVIDDRFAACGGIDMTSNRWDTRDHIERDARRESPTGRHYGPWHDITMLVEGEAAGALAELARLRWLRAGGGPLAPCEPQIHTPWPGKLKAQFTDVEIGIARTQAAFGNLPEVREVEALFVEHIRRARSFIYAESQYFAARAIAEAIAERLAAPNPPEIVLITPAEAEGWLEQAAMDGARVRLCHAIQAADRQGRFRVFIPYTGGGTPIYVHSKLMIVDDEVIRVGSSNMNNRSLGLDTECDLFIDAARPGNAHAAPAIRKLRLSLLAEHCAIPIAQAEAELNKHGSMAAMIAAQSTVGNHLQPFALRPLSEGEKAVADNALLDPERPEHLFDPFARHRGLFRLGGFLRRPK